MKPAIQCCDHHFVEPTDDVHDTYPSCPQPWNRQLPPKILK